MLAAAVASSSRFVSIWVSPGSRSARATAADSRKAMTAMAQAPGTRAPTWSNDGSAGVGKVRGTGAMGWTPSSSSHPGAARMIPAATTTSGPGSRGRNRLNRNSAVIEATDRTMVGTLARGSASTAATIDRMNPWPVNSESSPSSFGS